MLAQPAATQSTFVHCDLDSGVELALEPLPERTTVAMCLRMLTGVADDPPELTGVGALVERTLSKGTQRYDGRALANEFDARGVQWSSLSGRQSMLVRLVCLPEFALDAVDLVAEMFCHPTFPDEACRVAIELAQQDLKHIEDDPHELLRVMIQRLTLGPALGRYPGGEPETLARISRDDIQAHWRHWYDAGRLQVAAAGPLDVDRLAHRIDARFAGLGRPQRGGRGPADFIFQSNRRHRHKDLQQEYIAITLPGVPRDHQDFATERVLMGILSGGMSARLFTEVREKQGLVYWVGAWHEEPRGKGVIHLGASTTPERAHLTYETLLRELVRLAKDLTEEETCRARDGLIAQHETESDLTRARAADLSEDLFYFSRPVGLRLKIEALRAVTVADVAEFVQRLPRDQICVATLGPRAL